MAHSKTDLFDSKLNSAAVLFKALAHPARLAILQYLAETKVCITGDISGELPLSRTTINQHLTELNGELLRVLEMIVLKARENRDFDLSQVGGKLFRGYNGLGTSYVVFHKSL